MYNEKSLIDSAIEKYGGADDAYKLKLKNHIREAMGYSNYMGQLNAENNKPINVNLKGNITPGGVKQLVGGAMDIKNQNVNTLTNVVKGMDSAADSIAASQVAAGKSGRGKEGFENGVLFRPEDELDVALLGSVQNPINQDEFGKTSSVKSFQQMEAELNEQFQGKYTPEQIKERINQRVPADYMQNQGMYERMFRGFSEKQAKADQDFIRYGVMSEPEKAIFEATHPELQKDIQNYENVVKAMTDAHETEVVEDPATGEKIVSPKYTFDELVARNPSVTPEELKKKVKPYYITDIKNNVIDANLKEEVPMPEEFKSWYKWDNDKISKYDMLKKIYNGEDKSDKFKDGGINAVKKTATYQDLKSQIIGDYGDIISSGIEVDRILYQYLANKFEG